MRKFDCVTLEYFPEEKLLFWKIKDTGMPNFCLKGLEEFVEVRDWLFEYFSHPDRPLQFIVSGSEHQGVYNMGGDLPFFLECIRTKNIERLRRYAHLCIDAIYGIYNAFGLPAITIALVEGNAYGGGFECALAHDFIVATEHAKFCFPENKFNLFPGMGAHSLLSRKIPNPDADSLIRSNKMYTSRFLQSFGLIEKVTNSNGSMIELHQFIHQLRDRYNFEYHHIQCKKMINPLPKDELIHVTDLWVEACMNVQSFDLRKMEILAKAQQRKKIA
ncbi:crotonase/enoyl-CoA hydratase family protein [Aquimarina sp. D1M17]|uniref:crotonase/enoyl-CoA hydratase family protein n=1 Tax=Aquimarina acroporae TaxID=2937283 RepID=UPI0020BEF244|nr:crotonase/enoyl-CoA hydratase family protein [Aquimarina acroporae]MCK8521324.1 crotonase/enoyl-CoA hydratase family protein [Aquimarina acroporae]